MPKETLVKRGEKYLPGVQLPELEETYRREHPGKSRDRLQATVLRKRGGLLKEIAPYIGVGNQYRPSVAIQDGVRRFRVQARYQESR